MLIHVLKDADHNAEPTNIALQKTYQLHYNASIANFPNKEVIALRTEHMGSDLSALDHGIGAKGSFRNLMNLASKSTPVNLSLRNHTKRQWRDLCCILHADLEAYQLILNLARNLSYLERLDAMEAVWNICGINGQGRYGVEDVRTKAGNMVAREANNMIVVFSWLKWHQHWCPNLNSADDHLVLHGWSVRK